MKATLLTIRVEWDPEDGYDHPNTWFVRQAEKEFGDSMGLFLDLDRSEDTEAISGD